MATLDIIIVNWNTGARLAACLESIATAAGDGFEILRVCVVDNASVDHSADHLGGMEVPLTIIRNPDNRGFAAACNQGAAGSAADYLLFLNPDTRLFAGSLAVPIAFMEREGGESAGGVRERGGRTVVGPAENARGDVERGGGGRIGVVGIKLIGDDGAPHRACARFPGARHFLSRIFGLDILFPRLFPSYRLIDWSHDETRVVDQVTGAFFMVRRRPFEELGGFDERFFVYLEELDFSRRMHDAGWMSVYLADAAAYHRGGGASETDRGRRLFYALRSRLVYAGKHFKAPAAVAIALCTLCIEPFVRLVAALLGRSAVRLRETVNGFMLLWREAPCIIAMMSRHPDKLLTSR